MTVVETGWLIALGVWAAAECSGHLACGVHSWKWDIDVYCVAVIVILVGCVSVLDRRG